MNTRVLIGFADALAGIESAWCLTDHGFEVYAFARRGSRPALARSRSVHVVDISPPEQDATVSAKELAALARDLDPVAVMPLDDHALWLCDEAFGPASHGPTSPDVTVAGPLGSLAWLALDKREQLRLAAAAGFAVPPSADATAEKPPGSGPWIVKPALAVELREGALTRPVGRAASTFDEVRAVAEAIGGPAIVQPLVEGVGEGVFGLATADGVHAWSAHQRIRMMNPRGSGSSACRSAPVPDDLVDPVRALIARSGWRGLFMVELLRDSAGTPWFMELNGRAWGSMALARRRGYAYPAWGVRAALDPDFAPAELSPTPPHITARHLGREIVHLVAVLARGGAPRLTTVRDVLTPRRGERWYNWRRAEPSVFVTDTWITVRDQLGPRRRFG